ncbi:hypothetical protein HK100_007380 [Physocladia obscura]|uniref:Probable electron transfer flavoprotein subunit alpha, mitochondrial n=1 Tax=Physocladia obscura TaxID=109957 RepID=A0AAD5T4Q0_9FUNG|nr:hypothetical protein HK100_007380 [Physocladia obscura]
MSKSAISSRFPLGLAPEESSGSEFAPESGDDAYWSDSDVDEQTRRQSQLSRQQQQQQHQPQPQQNDRQHIRQQQNISIEQSQPPGITVSISALISIHNHSRMHMGWRRAVAGAGAPSRRAASTLVVGETTADGRVAASTLSAVGAAVQLGFPVTLLVLGGSDAGDAAAAKVHSVAHVLASPSKSLLPETVAPLVAAAVQTLKFSHVVAAASPLNKNWLPRAAALLDVEPVSDVIAINAPDSFVRPIYAGNAIATVKSADKIKLLTIRSTSFSPVDASSGSATSVAAPASEATPGSKWISEEVVKSDRPELGAAKVVIAGGRGMKNGENFKLLYDLADKVDGAVGASRAAVDAGFVGNDLQIGQTGKIVAPELYVAVGISGAIQHLAGMKDSKVIVSINKDADAPIFQVSDFGLVGDLFKIVPELTEKIKK